MAKTWIFSLDWIREMRLLPKPKKAGKEELLTQ